MLVGEMEYTDEAEVHRQIAGPACSSVLRHLLQQLLERHLHMRTHHFETQALSASMLTP